MKTPNLFVGSPVERIEDLRLLRGRGRYVDDLTREGVLRAAILRSPVAHGRLLGIDAAAALALPGVHAVFTAADIGSPVPLIPIARGAEQGLLPFAQPVIATGKIRYVGESLAIVVADSAAIAEDACDLIHADIEPLPALTDRVEAGRDQILLFEPPGTNTAVTYRVTLGDADGAFRQAAYTRRERFSVQRHTAIPMEPRGVLAEWDSATERLTVWGAAKMPFANRATLAAQMGLAETQIDLLEGDVGGGFGVRGEFHPEDFLVPFAARKLGRPVQWTEDRREHLLGSNHSRECDCVFEIACDRDGRILALRGEAWTDAGAYIRTYGAVNPRNIAQFASGPYAIPNIAIESSFVVTNKTPVGVYRGPGRFETDFFRERLFDIAAKELGLDPAEFRRRNLVPVDAMPYAMGSIAPMENPEELDSGDYLITLDRCLKEIGWAEKSALQGRLIDGRYHGVGIVCFIESGGSGPQENARLVLDPDGGVSAYVGTSAVGQSLATTLTQIAADALELPMDRIRIHHGSTTAVKMGYGSYGSRSTVMAGSAILLAAESLRRAIREAAGRLLSCAPDEIEIAEGEARGPGNRTLSFAALAAENLSVEETFFNRKHTFAYGAHAAHVTVDPRTGGVELLDYLSVEDVGKIVNPLTLDGQTIGAIVQGLGGVFLEHLIYDGEGQLLTGTLADYLMPTASDFPKIRSILLELYPSPINPLGVKGAGEGGTIPVGGVIANAVAAALSPLGVEIRDLPLSPSRLWEAIEAARGEG